MLTNNPLTSFKIFLTLIRFLNNKSMAAQCVGKLSMGFSHQNPIGHQILKPIPITKITFTGDEGRQRNKKTQWTH